MLKNRKYIYVGDPVPKINEQEHAAFLLNVQKGIVFSLEKRGLLTPSQRERCMTALENQYSQRKKTGRQA